ncbi:MAG: PAS domain S-box protein [Ignavibacteriae bacterium]|nr:PAS domain S-box protein [Ignavibacteriota bacterium]
MQTLFKNNKKSDSNVVLENSFLHDDNLLSDSVLNSVSEGISLTDFNGYVITTNETAVKLYGYDSLEEIKSVKGINLIVPTDRDRFETAMQKVLAIGSVTKEKFTCLKKNGDTFIAEISVTLLNDSRGLPLGYLGVTSNISEIESANEQLRLLVTALESSVNEVVITDGKGEIIWVNSSFNQLTGYDDNEILGKTPRILKSGLHGEQFYKNLWNTVLAGNVWSGEIINRKKSGELYNEEMTITPLDDGNGNITNFIAIKQDVTGKKKAELDLSKSEAQYKSLFENSTIGIYRADSDGNILVANNKFLKILGLNSIKDLIDVNIDAEYYQTIFNRESFIKTLTQNGKVNGFETQWKKSDGNIVHLRESAIAFMNNLGTLDYYEGIIEDITDNISAKKEIQKQLDILTAMRSVSEIFLNSTDWSKNINSAIEQIGKAVNVSKVHVCKKELNSENNIIFNHIAEWSNSSNEDENISNLQLNLNQNGLLRWDEELSKNNIIKSLVSNLPENEKLFLAALNVKSLIIVPVLLDGMYWGAISFHQTAQNRIWNDGEIEAIRAAAELFSAAIKRHNYECELLQAKQEAEYADRTKSEFLAQMSHEIRTPLNNITSFNTLIKDQLHDKIDDDVQEYFDVIDKASNRLIRTIDLILNLSELHTGSFKVKNTNFDVHSDLLERLFLENRFEAKQRSVDFKLINNATSTLVNADKYSLEQIFNNLIDNALKYTFEGKVEIVLENDNLNKLIVKVSDTGVGISEEYIPNIFKPFSQEEAGYTRKYDGNGIGLSLVKEYCELNNIDISIKSKKDKGTIATLKF